MIDITSTQRITDAFHYFSIAIANLITVCSDFRRNQRFYLLRVSIFLYERLLRLGDAQNIVQRAGRIEVSYY